MQVRNYLRNLSLGMAAGSFLLAGVAFAQSATLAGVNTTLVRELSSQNAKPGDTVEVKLAQGVKVDGVELPRETILIGKVDAVMASENRGRSSMSVDFTTARLKNGKEIPVKVIVLGAFPASQTDEESYSSDFVSPAPQSVSDQEQIDQEPGTLGRVAMTSSAQAPDSATFTNKDGNIRLAAGTWLQVGIRPLHGGTMASGS
jgi:hypothetical protein